MEFSNICNIIETISITWQFQTDIFDFDEHFESRNKFYLEMVETEKNVTKGDNILYKKKFELFLDTNLAAMCGKNTMVQFSKIFA